MRSFKSLVFLIVVLCLTDFAFSLPAPAKTAKKTTVAKKPATVKKPAVAKKPAVVKKPAPPAKAPPAKAPTKPAKAATTKKATTPAKTTGAAKKPATTKKPVTATKKPVTPAKKPATTGTKKAVGTAKPVNNGGAKNSTAPAKKPVTKPATNSTAKACPIRKPAAKPAKTTTATKVKAKAREFMDAVVRLYTREETEFIGFHGTNNENGRLYTSKGSLVVPPNFNGNDGELSGGLYVTDDLTTASVFAGSSASARINKAKQDGCPLAPTDDAAIAVVCAVEAKVKTTFVDTVSKIWIPPQEIAKLIAGVGNDPAKLAQQKKRITDAGDDPANTLRFSVLNAAKPKDPNTANQVMIPPGAFSNFKVGACVPVPKTGTQFGALTSFAGKQAFPAFNYRNQNQAWKLFGDPFGDIDPEDGDLGVPKKT